MFMFDWFRKKKIIVLDEKSPRRHIDGIESSLWDIKEEYDLPTEEIDIIVQSKRKNFDFLHNVMDKRNKTK